MKLSVPLALPSPVGPIAAMVGNRKGNYVMGRRMMVGSSEHELRPARRGKGWTIYSWEEGQRREKPTKATPLLGQTLCKVKGAETETNRAYGLRHQCDWCDLTRSGTSMVHGDVSVPHSWGSASTVYSAEQFGMRFRARVATDRCSSEMAHQ